MDVRKHLCISCTNHSIIQTAFIVSSTHPPTHPPTYLFASRTTTEGSSPVIEIQRTFPSSTSPMGSWK